MSPKKYKPAKEQLDELWLAAELASSSDDEAAKVSRLKEIISFAASAVGQSFSATNPEHLSLIDLHDMASIVGKAMLRLPLQEVAGAYILMMKFLTLELSENLQTQVQQKRQHKHKWMSGIEESCNTLCDLLKTNPLLSLAQESNFKAIEHHLRVISDQIKAMTKDHWHSEDFNEIALPLSTLKTFVDYIQKGMTKQLQAQANSDPKQAEGKQSATLPSEGKEDGDEEGVHL